MRRLLLGCLIISSLVAIGSQLIVPWDTQLDYSGRHGRSGIPVFAAALSGPLAIGMLLWSTRKPEGGHMNDANRKAAYILTPIIMGATLWCYWLVIRAILVAGGVLS